MHVCMFVCMSACRVAAKLSLSHAFCVLPYVLLPLQATVSFAALLLLFLLLLLLLLRVIVHVVICIGQTAVEQLGFAQWNKLDENAEYKTEKYIQIRLFGFLLTMCVYYLLLHT